MVENIIILIIVCVCAFFIGRKFYRQLKGKTPSCGCGCSGCDTPRQTVRKVSDKKETRKGGVSCNC